MIYILDLHILFLIIYSVVFVRFIGMKKRSRNTRILLWGAAFEIIGITFDLFLLSNEAYVLYESRQFWLTCLMLFYMVTPIPIYILSLYVKSYLSPQEDLKSYAYKLAIPIYVIFGLSIVSYFRPIMFDVDPNSYELLRGPAFVVLYSVELLYLFISLIMYYRNRHKMLIRDFKILGTIMTPTVIGALLQLVDYGVYAIYTGVTFSLVFAIIYLELLNTQNFIFEQLDHTIKSNKKKSNIWTN